MATLVNFTGFETGGLEEADSITGTPNVQFSVVRTGNFALELDAGEIYELAGLSGTKQIIGFAFRTPDVTPAANRLIMTAEGLAADEYEFYLLSSGELRITNLAIPANYDTVGLSLANNAWHYIEILRHADAIVGEFDLYVDGASEINIDGVDTINGGALMSLYRFSGATELFYIDDVYIYAGDSISDFLGPRTEVLGAFQNTVEDATDQGTALDQGTWLITGDTPGVDDGTPAGYTATAAETGYTRCDEGNRDGPLTLITGTAKGAKWLHRLQRGAGSGTNHYKRYGAYNGVADQVVDTAVTLAAALGNFFTITETDAQLPSDTDEYFCQGIRKDTGGREIYAADIWAFLLHVAPDPSTLDLTDMDFPDQNYYLGPFGT